nr:MMPL family transporter [Bacillus benzoevorans]
MIAWFVVVAGLFLMAPNMADLVREKGQITVPDEYSSTMASKILADAEEDGDGDAAETALVFYNENKLTNAEIKEAERAVRLLEKNKNELGINEILTHFNEKSLQDQLVSKDGKAILVSVSASWNGREAGELSQDLYQAIKDVKVDHYYTSSWMISEDLIQTSQDGVKKTEGITVVFILIVLLAVFRSFVAPIIPLLTVGFSYLASQSIVSILVDKVDFPLSTYTQIFLVVVLFGIGTDYCILLLSRFKEELALHETTAEAIVAAYRNAGRTVIFSGITVLFGFSAIGFSQFILYQSAVAVAIGVAILLLALFTIVPFFMAVLGNQLFWPSKAKAEHGDSKIWGVVGKFSLARPVLSLLLVAAVCTPFLITYNGELSFNSLEEMSDDVHSIKAFNAIAGSFSPGESMPTKVVIENDEAMDSVEYIDLAEKISRELEQVKLVSAVRSVTRPAGEPIEDFLIAKQAEKLHEGLGEGKDGLNQIKDGLNTASTELKNSEPELKNATAGINDLISGTDEIHSGLNEVGTNLAKIEAGIRQGSAGSDQMKAGLVEAEKGAEELLLGYTELQGGYVAMQGKIPQLLTGYQQIAGSTAGLADSINQANGALYGYVEQKYTDLLADPTYLAMKGNADSLQGQFASLVQGLNELNNGLSAINDGLSTANAHFEQALAGQANLVSGLQQLIAGIEAQQAGLNQLADGQGQLAGAIPELSNGVAQVNGGQEQLLEGFSDLGGQITQLSDGLDQSVDGLNKVSEGLGSAQDYLSGLSQSDRSAGFYLPQEVLQSEDFAKVLDVYLSDNRKVMTLDVVLEENPYSSEAMAQIPELKKAVERAVKDTKLENAHIAFGGVSSMNADLDTMSGNDFSRTAILMLVGITLILFFLFRSLIMPLYIIGSLIVTYYTSLAVNEMIFVHIMGYSGISWAVPFFAFVILIALGVDYSIFLMDRFNEYKSLSVTDAMLLAMKKMGTVILSAALILGGTFAAMIPSGMLSLVQISTIVVVGLLLYAVIILPLFIPVMVKVFGKANWWPFRKSQME